MQSTDVRAAVFWCGTIALIGIRLLLTSDLSVQINYAPHDDSLYVLRAYHLLRGEAFGPYDARILVKYPGISLWLAGTRSLGIPFLLSVNALYIGAGLYLAHAFLQGGVNRWLVFAAFALYLFNPITFGYEWLRVIREPLGTGMLVLIAGATANIFIKAAQGRPPWLHATVLALAFAFALYLREDDRLLYGFLVLVAAALAWQTIRRRTSSRAMKVFLLAVFFGPLALGEAYEYAWRGFVERHYGLPVLHEFSDGEYPRLLAAIRSIQSAKDNRMVMVTQEALTKLTSEAPSFRPVIERLPKPTAGSFSCRLHGVCSEWSNGWMPFLIKDEAFRAGLTPNLPAAQAYFRRVRVEIERACGERRLSCNDKGQNLVPPMELRWTRAYVVEGWRLARMALAPDIDRISAIPLVYDVPIGLGRIYQAMTMADYFDTHLQENFGEQPSTRIYENPIAELRSALIAPYQAIGQLLILAAFAALIVRLWIAHRAPLGPLALASSVIGLYLLFRFAALAYVAVFMGAFSGRMMFASYAVSVAFSLPFLAETLVALRNTLRNGKS